MIGPWEIKPACTCIKCPECNGDGMVYFSPSGEASPHQTDCWSDWYTCPTCDGYGVVEMCDSCAGYESEEDY